MGRPRVVIVGAGFGGLAAARALGDRELDVTVIDRANHHLFQPLLYQVATAGLSPADIAAPIRSILRRFRNVDVRMDEVVGLDLGERWVLLADTEPLRFDYLVLATGATHSYFGHGDWAEYAPGLKSIEDAVAMRRKILMAFERAENHPEMAERTLTFAIVGGGPTGVEMAGAIAELARRTLVRDFDHIEPQSAKILLLEGGTRLLSSFPEGLSRRAEADLRALGVDVRLGTRVTRIGADFLEVGDDTIHAGCIVWAAGVAATPAAHWLGVESDRAGRVPVDERLEVAGIRDVFVVGDLAATTSALPGIAPVAMQGGRYVAKVIQARVAGRPDPGVFRYVDKGNLATIGRKRAVGELRGVGFSGFAAWFVWLSVHIFYLIGFRNKLLVLLQWAWSYMTWERGARLIVGRDPEEQPNREERDRRQPPAALAVAEADEAGRGEDDGKQP